MCKLELLILTALMFAVSGCDSSRKSTTKSETKVTTSQISKNGTHNRVTRTQVQRQAVEMLAHRNRRSHYSEMYRKLPANLSINGTMTIRQEMQPYNVGDIHSNPYEETQLDLLPIWQRESVAKIRAKRQQIYEEGRRDAASIRSGTPEERRAWTLQWREKVKSQLDQLKKEEAISLRSQATVTKEMSFNLLNRLNEADPVLGESDLPIIESLLPSADEFNKNRDLKIDDEIAKLLEAHKILSEQFPQSVNSNGLH
jgi:hypothetical protein